MNAQINDFQVNAGRFSDVVDRGGDWGGVSPCEDWTAADVLHHVVDTQRGFFEQREAVLGDRPSGDPPEVWRAHLGAVGRAVADTGFVTTEYDGHFGRTTVAGTLADFYGFDLLVHRWDLARGLGHDLTFDEAELDRIEQALDGFGDALYAEGVCRPPVEVPDGAPRQVRLLARMGRRA